MYKASMEIDVGKDAKRYLELMETDMKYKRGGVKASLSNGLIRINVEASDQVALLASMGSALKQLRIITSVDGTVSRLVG